MGRKRIYRKVRIADIIQKIALWELVGEDKMALGLRQFFQGAIKKEDVEAEKEKLIELNPDLAPPNYDRDKRTGELFGQWSDKAAKGNGNGNRKTGTFREIRTIRNRAGRGGTTYKWEYDVTYENGRRIKSKSIGRVSD